MVEAADERIAGVPVDDEDGDPPARSDGDVTR